MKRAPINTYSSDLPSPIMPSTWASGRRPTRLVRRFRCIRARSGFRKSLARQYPGRLRHHRIHGGKRLLHTHLASCAASQFRSWIGSRTG